jgi:hypothetical protein
MLLRIYLNDHLAGSGAGHALAKRCASENPDTELSAFLEQLASHIEEERGIVRDVLRALELRENVAKQAMAWALEKFGRLKPNGRLVRYSDLSRLLELEGLLLGVTGKLGLWRALERVSLTDDRLASFDFERLIHRAEQQQSTLERFRLRAVDQAFGAEIQPSVSADQPA